MRYIIFSAILAIVILVTVTVFPEKTAMYKQGYQAGRQSILDSLHHDTLLMIKEVDSIIVKGKAMFPDNAAYEAWMEEMLRRKAK